MRSLILSQCRDLRIGVTREDLGALTTVRARQINIDLADNDCTVLHNTSTVR